MEVEALTAIAFDRWTLLLAGAVYFGLRFVSRLVEAAANDVLTLWSRRVLPFLPEVLGVAASVAGGVPTVSHEPVLVRAAVGLWVAYVAAKFHKVLGQTVLADDRRLEAAFRRRFRRRRGVYDDG